MPRKETKIIDRMLRDAGAVLLRSNKHCVYMLPGGARFTASLSPSSRGAMNEMMRLRRIIRSDAIAKKEKEQP